MSELKVISWFLWLYASYVLVLVTVGSRRLTQMFPEGHRWWHGWAEFFAMVFFGLAAIFNPWR